MLALHCCLLCPGEPLPLPPGHDAAVTHVAFSPDGKHLVSGDKDGRLIVWDAKTWAVIDVLREPDHEVTSLGFDDGKLVWRTRGRRSEQSLIRVRDLDRRRNLRVLTPPSSLEWPSDGKTRVTNVKAALEFRDAKSNKLLATADDAGPILGVGPAAKVIATMPSSKSVALWDVAGRGQIGTVALKHETSVVAPSDDGSHVAVGRGAFFIDLHDAKKGKLVGRFQVTSRGLSRPVTALAFSPDGKCLAAANGSEVNLYDVSTREEQRAFRFESTRDRAHSLSKDGGRIALRGYSFRVMETATGREIWRGDENAADPIAISPDGKWVLHPEGDGDKKKIRLWEVDSGKSLAAWPASDTFCVAFAPDGKTVALGGARSGAVRLCDPLTGKDRLPPIRLTGKDSKPLGWLDRIVFSPDGRQLIARASEGPLVVLSGGTGKEERRLDGRAVAYRPDGKLVASGDAKGVRLWDPATGKVVAELKAPADEVAFHPTGQFLLTWHRDNVEVWHVDSRRVVWRQKSRSKSPSFAAFLPGGRLLTTDDETWVRDLPLENFRQVVAGHQGRATAAAFDAKAGRLVTGGEDRVVRVWDVATGKRLAAHPEADGPINAVALSPDGTAVASRAGGKLRLSDALTGEGRWTAKSSIDPGWRFRFGPGGKSVIAVTTTADGLPCVKLWDAASGEPSGGRDGSALSPDGSRVALATKDAIEVRDRATGKTLLKLDGRATAAFSGDGKRLGVIGSDGTARVYDLTSGKQHGKSASLPKEPPGKPSLALSHDGTKAALWRGEVIRLADVVSGKTRPLAHKPKDRDGTLGVEFAGEFVIDRESGFVYDFEGNWRHALAGRIEDVLSGDYLLVSDPTRGTVRWHPETDVSAPVAGPGGGRFLALSPGGKLAAFELDGAVTVWAVPESKK